MSRKERDFRRLIEDLGISIEATHQGGRHMLLFLRNARGETRKYPVSRGTGSLDRRAMRNARAELVAFAEGRRE